MVAQPLDRIGLIHRTFVKHVNADQDEVLQETIDSRVVNLSVRIVVKNPSKGFEDTTPILSRSAPLEMGQKSVHGAARTRPFANGIECTPRRLGDGPGYRTNAIDRFSKIGLR
jgi:hypothetical protein